MHSRLGSLVFRFRLQTMLVIVTAGIVALGLVTGELNRERLRKQIAEQIRQLDGSVRYSSMPKHEQTGVVNGYLRVFLGDKHFTEVEHVSLKPRTEADVNLLRSFPEIRTLSLSGAHAKLEYLADLPHLEGLYLEDVILNERGMQALAMLPYVSDLRFANCGLADQSFKPLTELPKLRSLEFYNCSMPDELLKSLTHASNLSLSFRNCTLSDSALSSMHGARSSVQLNLIETSVTEAGILAIWEANPAWSVRYSSGKDDVNMLPSMKELPQIDKLSFQGPLTSDATLAILAAACGLTNLELKKCCLTDAGLKNLRPLQNLQSLSINGVPITDGGLQALNGLTKLQVLRLTETKIEGFGLGLLPSSIRTLVSDVNDRGLADIAKLTDLEVLWLMNPRITDEGVEHLAKMSSLRQLYFLGTSVSGSGVARLQSSLPNCSIATE